MEGNESPNNTILRTQQFGQMKLVKFGSKKAELSIGLYDLHYNNVMYKLYVDFKFKSKVFMGNVK